MSALITVVLLILSFLVALSIPVILKFKGTGNSELADVAEATTKKKPKEKVNLKTLWEIEDIKHGVIKLTGNRYRMVMRLASADFFLLGEGEQTQVEDALIAVLMGLSFPVQFLVTSEAINTRKAVQDVKEGIYRLPAQIRNYAQEYATYMEGLTSERTVAARSAYCVISFDTDKGIDYARIELMARATSLSDGFQMAKIQSELLDTAALVDLLSHLLNRGRTWRPSEADAQGVMELYHVGQISQGQSEAVLTNA